MNQKAPHEMIEKLHPLGRFEGEKVIMSESFDTQGGFDEMYKIVLQDTPIGPYFEEYLEVVHKESNDGSQAPAGNMDNEVKVGDALQKEDLEFMKAALKKYWLEDFYRFVMQCGGTTAEVLARGLLPLRHAVRRHHR